ncbi:MAG TPA: 2-phospho-L-lactate guanylyltransferase [Nitrososphaerales archaeon]|nr:2-phospho-L-lactate guanylyltransferase [Nitrososphaerales archaeon]
MTKTFAVIPVRDFANTKLRLGRFLTETQRAELTKSMLLIALRALEGSVVDRVVVVASNPSEVRDAIGELTKVAVLREHSRRGGVNNAMQTGMDYLADVLNQGGKNSGLPSIPRNYQVMLIPSDLPLLDSSSINQMVALKETCDMLINPSRKRDGTSLLLMERGKAIPLHYDNNSFVKHVDEARKMGLNFRITDARQFSFDIDDQEDLRLLSQELGSSNFEELIRTLRSCPDGHPLR